MRAAVVHSFDHPPRYGSFAEPAAGTDEAVVQVSAAALSPLVKAQAGGRHYSSEAAFPFIPGVDGVGRLADGSRVYFAFPPRPYGAMAEWVAVPSRLRAPVPAAVDDATAAALANPDRFRQRRDNPAAGRRPAQLRPRAPRQRARQLLVRRPRRRRRRDAGGRGAREAADRARNGSAGGGRERLDARDRRAAAGVRSLAPLLKCAQSSMPFGECSRSDVRSVSATDGRVLITVAAA